MAESISTVSGGWAPVVVALLGVLALVAATVDSVATARGDGSGTTGLTGPLRSTVRLMRQRRRTTLEADRPLWRLGGAGLFVVACLMVAVVPLDRWVLLDPDVGVVWFNAMDVLVWALVWLVGWGPNSTHSLVGAYRFLAHALAYELPLMFALVAPAIAAASLRVGDIALAQQDLWYAVWMPAAFAVYCVGVLGFSLRGPFTPTVGADIAGGVTAELSGVDRLVFVIGRHALLVAGAAFAVPLFLGGGAGPLLPGWLWVVVKTVVLLVALVLLRRRIPAIRPDLFMELGWLVLLPLALVQDLVVALVVMGRG